VPKLGLLGSVRGVRSNAHPYRKQHRPIGDIRERQLWSAPLRTANAVSASSLLGDLLPQKNAHGA